MSKRRFEGVTPLGGGRYRIRAELRHPKTGRTHELDRRVTAPSAADAASLLASARDEWLSKRARGADRARRRRLGEALAAWLRDKPDLKASTRSTYGTAVAWWTKVLGDYYVDAVEPRDVREALAGARDAGRASDTLSGYLRVLRTFAAEEGHGAIVEGVRVKREVREDEARERRGRGLTLDELRRLLEHGPSAWKRNNGDVQPAWRRSWALVETMALTGLRFGEASALEWQDVDLDDCTIRVRRAQWRGIVDHPKAKASKRVVVIPESLADTLREHRRAMIARQQRGVASALVFPSRRSSASYVTDGYAGKTMLRACRAASIELAGRPWVHALRHTWNNLVRQHTSEIVRRALIGHADEESGDRYSHVVDDEKRKAVASVVRLVRS
jgi:integrase